MNTLIRTAKAGIAALLALMLGACVTQLGRDFDDTFVRQITPGTTTKAEVRTKLGRPPLVTRGSEEDVWIYAYYEGAGASTKFKNWFGRTDYGNPLGTQQKRLVVTFKGDNVKEARFTQELPLPDPLEPAYR